MDEGAGKYVAGWMKPVETLLLFKEQIEQIKFLFSVTCCEPIMFVSCKPLRNIFYQMNDLERVQVSFVGMLKARLQRQRNQEHSIFWVAWIFSEKVNFAFAVEQW